MKHARSSSLLYLLERTLRQARGSLQGSFREKKLDISVDQWIILSFIAEHDAPSQRMIAQGTAKDPASVTRIVDILEKKKFAQRSEVKSDKRQFRIMITPSGKKMITQCRICLEKFRKKSGKGIVQAELNDQGKILDRIYFNCGGR
ncbi:MAG: MarR family transcriptional regulator [Bacteroidetes bacterium]|nr:MarR family transcriptional regulator [Bacteroidota bacterium]